MTLPNPIRRELVYYPFDWQTHPIDCVQQSQGWGPMAGPYTPFNFPSVAMSMGNGGIDITYNAGDNQNRYGVPFATMTIFADRSTALVNNRQSAPMSNISAFAPIGAGGGSTIVQGTPSIVPAKRTPASALAGLRKMLGMT